MKKYFSFIIFLLISCSGTQPIVENNPSENKGSKFEIILQSAFGGPETPGIIIAKEPSVVKDFFNYINRTRKPGLAIPEVDYSKEMLVIIYMGRKNTAGYSVGVDNLRETDSEVVIYVKEESPNSDDIVSQVITHPFTVVKLARNNKKMSFSKI